MLCDWLKSYFRWLILWATSPCRPGSLYVVLEELPMADRFRVHVLLPPPDLAQADPPVSRVLSRSLNGGAAVEEIVTLTDTESVFEADEGDDVALALVDVDNAGNRSVPSVRTFTVVDNVPPAQPGELQVTLEELAAPPPPSP